MKQTVLYDEAYGYDVNFKNAFNIHFDYGTRYNQINMIFSHFHPYYEIYFLLNGTAQHFIEGQCFNLNTYDFVMLRPYQLHKTNYFKHQPCKRMIISFNPLLLEDIAPDFTDVLGFLFDNPQPIYRFNSSTTSELIQLFNSMYKASKQKKQMSDLLITSYMIQAIEKIHVHQIDNEYTNDLPDEHSQNNNTLEKKIYEITSHIHRNYMNPLTLDSIAKDFFISPHYLSRQFKLFTGFTMVQYIQETRVKRAQEYLLDTNYKVTEIIDLCGFGSISQFNRVFSKLIGCTPTDFRSGNRLQAD